MRSHWATGTLLGILLGLVGAAGAQVPTETTPKTINAKIETRAVSGPLETAFRSTVAQQAAPAWVGYAVPRLRGEHVLCCGNYDVSEGGVRGNCGLCRLEGHDTETSTASREGGTVKLEEPRSIFVLFRAEKGAVGKIRVASEDCELDAGGLPFVWLTAVKPAESVALLETFVRSGYSESGEERKLGEAALLAIVMHDGEAADRALERFTAADRPEKLRERTAFWLGTARGPAGLGMLKQMAARDPSPHVRGQVAFALSVSREPSSVDEMIRMARNDESAHVRGQTLFWLGQKAGKKAAGAISGAIENDPDTDVKKKAVFALSQLPKDEGVPKLIEVARTNRNPAVRKQAMFWLGQSNDPRALAFFEQVLMH